MSEGVSHFLRRTLGFTAGAQHRALQTGRAPVDVMVEDRGLAAAQALLADLESKTTRLEGLIAEYKEAENVLHAIIDNQRAEIAALRNRTVRGKRLISPDMVLSFVAEEAKLTVPMLCGVRKPRLYSWPRMMAGALIAELRPDLSLPAVGRIMGGKDHTTVMYYIRRIHEMEKDDRLPPIWGKLRARLGLPEKLPAVGLANYRWMK